MVNFGQIPRDGILRVDFDAGVGTPAGVEVMSLSEFRRRGAVRFTTPQRPDFHHLIATVSGTLKEEVRAVRSAWLTRSHNGYVRRRASDKSGVSSLSRGRREICATGTRRRESPDRGAECERRLFGALVEVFGEVCGIGEAESCGDRRSRAIAVGE